MAKRWKHWPKAKEIFLRYHKYCEICGATEKIEVHHKISVALGGFNGWGNLQAVCENCHREITAREHKANCWFDAAMQKLQKELKKRNYSEMQIYRVLNRFMEPPPWSR